MALNQKYFTRLNKSSNEQYIHRSDLTPNPGPFGGSVSVVSPPAGSQENLPLLRRKTNQN